MKSVNLFLLNVTMCLMIDHREHVELPWRSS